MKAPTFEATRRRVLVALLVSAVTVACSSNDSSEGATSETTTSRSSGGGGGSANTAHGSGGEGITGGSTSGASGRTSSSGAGGGAGASGDGAVYLVFSTIDDPEGRTSYYMTTPSIEGDITVDVTEGIEQAGNGQVYAPPEGGYVLIGGGEEPTFTRWELNDAGELEEGDTISFANLGVEGTHRHMIFVDETKAYFLDEAQLQLVSFNPTTMKLHGAIPVHDFECEEVVTAFGTPIRREDGFYFTRSCWDLEVTSPGSTLVHVDPETDAITITHDERCMGMQVGFLADSGDAYWFSDSDASVEWSQLALDTPHDCALRLKAGETSFDEDWELDLTTLTGGLAAVASVPFRGSEIWMRVFDPTLVEDPLPFEAMDWGLQAWRWGLLDVASGDPIEIDHDAEPLGSYGVPIYVEGRAFSPSSNSTYTETTLVELTSSGPRERMHVQGELRKVFRLR